MKIKNLSLLLVFVSFSLYPSQKNEVKKVLTSFLDEIKAIKGMEKDIKPSSSDIKKNKILSNKALNKINFQYISRKSLGEKTWSKIGKTKQKMFIETLSRLIALNAFPRSNVFLNNVKSSFSDTIAKGNEIKIRQTVVIPGDEENPEDTNMFIDYFYQKDANSWKLTNLSFDDVSLIETYSNQFANIINKKSFDHLLSLMQNKKKELEKEYGSIIPR
jgi:ABC-type transporter MlaC component